MKNSPETPPSDALPPQVQIGKMILGKFTTQLLYVAAKLELADMLINGPKHVDDLAATAKVHAPSLYRIMRTLAGLGVFTEQEPNQFALTPLAETLRTDSPVSQKHLALFMGAEFHNLAWANILHTVKTGESAFENRFGTDFFSYLQEHSDAMAALQNLMTVSSNQEADELCSNYDFSSFRTVVDVGGGQGMLLTRILKANPSLKGILFDFPPVASEASLAARTPDIENRLKIVGGDFFEKIPRGGDAYIIKRVLHDWDDEQSAKILGNCRRAMNSTGRVLVLEQVIPPGDVPSFGKFSDIEMLVMSSGGKERTREEFEHIFLSANLSLHRIVNLNSFSILEAGL